MYNVLQKKQRVGIKIHASWAVFLRGGEKDIEMLNVR